MRLKRGGPYFIMVQLAKKKRSLEKMPDKREVKPRKHEKVHRRIESEGSEGVFLLMTKNAIVPVKRNYINFDCSTRE